MPGESILDVAASFDYADDEMPASGLGMTKRGRAATERFDIGRHA
jgi:hypothetical protein